MPQLCTVCRHPQRLRIEQAIVAGTSLRDIAAQFGTAKTIIARHRTHIAGDIARHVEAREAVRAHTLLDDVVVGGQRAESRYATAQQILKNALDAGDPRVAIQAVRAASAVMGEARNYLTLRGELTNELSRDRTQASMSIQIIRPSAGSSEPPRIVFGQDGGRTIEGETIEVESEIGIQQRR
jgi:hypothetical protein